MRIFIDRINSAGQGIGENGDGKTVFVDGALPGEEVEARVLVDKKSYVQAKVQDVLKPSAGRVRPGCVWYERCGGCQLQHAGYDLQVELKEDIALDSLRRLGKLDVSEVACRRSPLEWGYRNKASFPVRVAGRKPEIGFFKAGTHRLVSVEGCPVISDEANALYGAIRELVHEGRFSVYSEQSRKGWLRHVVIRSSVATGKLFLLMVVTETLSKQELRDFGGLLDYLRDDVPELCGLALNVNDSSGNVILGEKTVHVAGEEFIEERLGDFTLRYDGTSFFQANPLQAEALFEYAASFVDGEDVLELYCGVGALTLFLARRANSVTAYESWLPAVELAKDNAEVNGFSNVVFQSGDVGSEVSVEMLSSCDTLVVDPPRGGLERSLVQAVLESGLKKIVYVSCNPATFARDVNLLEDGGFKLDVGSLQAFDMFPQTSHVELVGMLER